MQELSSQQRTKISSQEEFDSSQSPERLTLDSKPGLGLQAMSGDVCTGKPKVPPIKVKSIQQMSSLQFLSTILKNISELNFGSSNRKDSSIFNIDDMLVELAMLKTNKKLMQDLVFFFKIKTDSGQKWSIKRNYQQIEAMSKSLTRFSIKIPVNHPKIPEYDPSYPEMLKALTHYLNELLTWYQSDANTMKKLHIFLEVTSLRGQEVGTIIKAGWASKGIGGRYKTHKLVQFVKQNFACCWGKKYFILSEEGIGYTNEYDQKEFRDILFFDRTLRVRHGEKYGESDFTIVLYTSSRKLKVRHNTLLDMLDWMDALAISIMKSPYCKLLRYRSFCPLSYDNHATSYINASKYYNDVCDDLEKAKHEIYITDWWMSPEVYLKRPIKVKEDGESLDITHRLDMVLKRAAERGCKIFILLYREFEQALPNKSNYTQQTLMNLHPNIEVVRHPACLIFLWSHHEKIVVIDQCKVYLGGLDLCYGRFDLDNYPLSEPDDRPGHIYFPGQDYSNVRIKDFSDVDTIFKPLVDKNTTPRMPWRDIAVRLMGPVTKDVSRHFIQYWNFAKSDLEGSSRRNFLYKKDFEQQDSEASLKKKKKYKCNLLAAGKKKSGAQDEDMMQLSVDRGTLLDETQGGIEDSSAEKAVTRPSMINFAQTTPKKSMLTKAPSSIFGIKETIAERKWSRLKKANLDGGLSMMLKYTFSNSANPRSILMRQNWLKLMQIILLRMRLCYRPKSRRG